MDNSTVIILGSNRKQGNTQKFVTDTYGIITPKVIDLLDYTITPYCYDNAYPYNDQFKQIIAEVLNYDVIVLATPVYWYSMSGTMKTFFDRLTDLVTIDKATGRLFKDKVMKVLASGYDECLPVGFEVPFRQTADYFDMIYEGCRYCSVAEELTPS
jgi:multimeric flavodoxin WrbA